MQSISEKLIITKSQNSIPVYGLPFSPFSYSIALTANTDAALAIPVGLDVAVIHYSAGATVIVNQAILADTISAPSGSFTQTTERINPPVCAVSAVDENNVQQYLHLYSPNPTDWVVVAFYNDGTIV